MISDTYQGFIDYSEDQCSRADKSKLWEPCGELGFKFDKIQAMIADDSPPSPKMRAAANLLDDEGY